jgi:hypothetical protein
METELPRPWLLDSNPLLGPLSPRGSLHLFCLSRLPIFMLSLHPWTSLFTYARQGPKKREKKKTSITRIVDVSYFHKLDFPCKLGDPEEPG